MYYISGFYKFKKITNAKKIKKILQKYFFSNNIRGTIIISSEGVNGTLSSNKENLISVINKIKKTFKFIKFDSINFPLADFYLFIEAKLKLRQKSFQWE